MISSLVKVLRPAAAVTAVVLVAGVVQAVPAAGAPRDPFYSAVSISAHVTYPADDDTPGSPGTDIDHPADAGHAPGSVVVGYESTNVGTDALQYFYEGDPLPLAVGHRDSYGCETPPVFPPEEWELQPTQTVHCTESVSQIPAGVKLEIGIGVRALGIYTGLNPTDTTRVWAEVDAPAPRPPRLPPPWATSSTSTPTTTGSPTRTNPASLVRGSRSGDPTASR